MLVASPTTEAMHQQADIMTAGAETMTAYLPTTWTILAIAAMTTITIVTITTAMKEYGRGRSKPTY
jgi:hypothetical protein